MEADNDGALLATVNSLLAGDRWAEAQAACRTLTETHPANAAAWYWLGRISARLSQLDLALSSLARAVDLAPDNAAAWRDLAAVNGRMGNMDGVEACCLKLLALNQRDAGTHVMLGHVNHSRGRLDESFAHYQRALSLNPQSVVALNGMGASVRTPDDLERYLQAYRAAVVKLPDPVPARAAFIDLVRRYAPCRDEPWLRRELLRCYTVPDVDYQPLAAVTAVLLRHHHGITGGGAPADGRRVAATIGADPLFRAFLEKTVNVDPVMEAALARARAAMLLDEGGPDPAAAAALAMQSLNNEFALQAGDAEQVRVDALQADVEGRAAGMDSPDAALESALLRLAMYQRLATLPCARALQGMALEGWSATLWPLLTVALLQPLEEETIKSAIPVFGGIEDPTSRLVRSQYEENPYPRWLALPEAKRRDARMPAGVVLRQQFPHYTPAHALNGPVNVLIAGGGTGRHPLSRALTYRDAEVLAIDISKSSLAYGARMAKVYGVTNVSFMQADILSLGRLDQRFHIIESVGVLHHMEDPMSGWRVLCGLLAEGGVMSIALYSERARRHFVAAQQRILDEGLGTSPDAIRAFRRRVIDGDLPELGEILKYTDFYSLSACRDLLFHYKEHRYTLPRIKAMLDELGLELIGFTFGDDKVKALYREQFPQDPTMTDLALWEQFEARHPDTFAGMYYFWCRKA